MTMDILKTLKEMGITSSSGKDVETLGKELLDELEFEINTQHQKTEIIQNDIDLAKKDKSAHENDLRLNLFNISRALEKESLLMRLLKIEGETGKYFEEYHKILEGDDNATD